MVAELEDIFTGLERKMKQRQKAAWEAAEKLSDGKAAAAETMRVATEKLAEAEAAMSGCRITVARCVAELAQARRQEHRAKKAERAVEAAQRAADFLRERPRRATSAGSPTRDQALEHAEQRLKEAQEKERKENEEQGKDGSLSVIGASVEAAIQAQEKANGTLKESAKAHGEAAQVYEEAMKALAVLQDRTEEVRCDYLAAEEEAGAFYKDLSAFRYLQTWSQNCDFEPPADWSPRRPPKRPRLLDESIGAS